MPGLVDIFDKVLGASKRNSTTHGEFASEQIHLPLTSLVLRQRALARRGGFVLAAAMLTVPLLYGGQHSGGQHSGGGQYGGGSHAPAPRNAAPRPQQPSAAPKYGSVGPGYAPRPAPLAPGPPPAYHPNSPYAAPRTYGPPSANTRDPHLGSWLQNHQGESFVGQENALRREPGFNRLPQQQQQRLIDRLHQLDSMPPQQRQRTLGRIENMERLSPERRQAVSNSARDLSSMDPARKEQVRGAFRALRDLPPGEREQALNSPAYRSMYSDHERQILGNLLSVEPYQPR